MEKHLWFPGSQDLGSMVTETFHQELPMVKNNLGLAINQLQTNGMLAEVLSRRFFFSTTKMNIWYQVTEHFSSLGKHPIDDQSILMRSPSFEFSSVLYISPTDTSSMQNLILEGLQQKLQKSCSRCNKNTLHFESSYILQPPKYFSLLIDLDTLMIISPKIDAPYL